MYSVLFGNHRAIAVIILAKSHANTLAKKGIKKGINNDAMIIGEVVGRKNGVVHEKRRLTVGELISLFTYKQLYTKNTGGGIDKYHFENILKNFEPHKLFDKNRDEGIGILLVNNHDNDIGLPFDIIHDRSGAFPSLKQYLLSEWDIRQY